jgi:hypothetical protein
MLVGFDRAGAQPLDLGLDAALLGEQRIEPVLVLGENTLLRFTRRSSCFSSL